MISLKSSLKSQLNSKLILRVMSIVSLVGIIDTAYLTINHYFGNGVECLILEGCEIVLVSSYSVIWGIPLALLGLVFYAGMFILISMTDIYGHKLLPGALVLAGLIGFSASLIFLYLQAFVIKALCIYCLTSFVSSTLLFILAIMYVRRFKIV